MDQRQRVNEYVRRKKEQGGSEQMVNYKTDVKNTRKEYQARLRELQNDPRLPDREKYQMIADLNREYSTAMNEARRDAEAAFHALIQRLEKDANPAPVRGQRSTAELMERRELRDDLERKWQRDQVYVMEGYKEALRTGDTMAAELHEEYGREFMKDNALRQEFAALAAEQKAARMSPRQRAAVEALEELKAEGAVLMLGIAHEVHLAAGDRQNALSGRPIVTRDDPIEVRRAMMAQAGGR